MAVHLLAALLPLAPPTAAENAPRLLTGLSVEVSPSSVALTWTVDESRADRITGFTCVYRTPGHLKTGVSGGVPCGPVGSPADARRREVTGLPEYGDYEFEVAAIESGGGPGTPWPLRALRRGVAVTQEFAGRSGSGRVVSGTGPLVKACRPDDAAPRQPWRPEDIVSASPLTHYPSRGWTPDDEPEVFPDWPEGGTEGHFPRLITAIGTGTKALLRPGATGGLELRLHSSHPFGDDYAFGPAHAVAGWADATHPAVWPALWNREDCPPEKQPDATHDVALSLSSHAGDGRRLNHAGYGWWTVAPVGPIPDQAVAAKGGLSWGASPAAPPREAGTRWRGRASGHLFWDRRRWALAGDVELALAPGSGVPLLAGRIVNVVLAPLDPKTLAPAGGPPAWLPELLLKAGAEDGGVWSGTMAIAETPAGMPPGFPAAAAFKGDWHATAHGPEAEETAGRLRLWTPAHTDPNRAAEGLRQAVLVVGFGAAKADGGDQLTQEEPASRDEPGPTDLRRSPAQ